jgi:gliding motility-associated-like protein
LKRSILLTFALFSFITFTLSAANRYWVGGSGSWNDSKHWAATSGGKGGATVPGNDDDVYFNDLSFAKQGQTVSITDSAICRTLSWSSLNGELSLKSNAGLYISGSLQFVKGANTDLKGSIHFVSGKKQNVIALPDRSLSGDLYFQGEGSWTLRTAISTSGNVIVERGDLITGNNEISCNEFLSRGDSERSLKAGASRINVNAWKMEGKEKGFELNGSQIKFKSDLTADNFFPGNISYGDLSAPAMVCNFTVTASGTANTCNGSCDGTATAVVTGGVAPYAYIWNPSSQTTPTATGLCAGTYIVVVTDALGNQCFATASITEPAALIPFPTSITNATCNGVCNGSATIQAVGGTPPYTYSWSTTPAQTNATANNLCAGVYTVTVTDQNLCSANNTITITQPNVLLPNGTSTNVTCFGFCDGTASVSPTGGTLPYSYLWSTNATTSSINSLCPGNYSVTITDNNSCTTTYSATITQPTQLAVSVTKTNATCGSVCNGTANATANGGTLPYSYSWSPGGQTTPSVSGLCAGSYTLTVTDANNCTINQTVIITEPLPLVTVPTGVNISCFNQCNGTASANAAGGTPQYNYLWSPGNQTTPAISNLCQGTYTVNISDANGCTASGTVTINEPTLLVSNGSGTNITCFSLCNGSATASPTGGTAPYTYNWMPGGSTNQSITNLCQGSYTLTVTDANGCTGTDIITITQPLPLAANAVKTNASCNGSCDGTATASPSGGTGPYSFSWVPGGQTTASITGLCAGNYTVTVTDANGCATTQSVNIIQPNPLSTTASGTNIPCNAGCTSTISANIGGGTAPYTYSWSPGGQTTPSISGQCAGSYTVTVTDANGCTATANTTVNQPTALTVITQSTNATCNASCNGTAAGIAGGGTPPYGYMWSPGGQTTTSVSNLCAGTYTLTVTDANGCQGTSTITITEPPVLQTNMTSTDVTCNNACNGNATVAPSGGTAPYSFQWSPGGATTPTITNLCAGSYTVIVTDASNCVSIQSVQITQPTPLNPVILATTSSCNICNGSATSSVVGGTGPYTYSWNTTPAAQTTTTATGLCPGSYTLTVTDANSCTATAVATVNQTVNIIITSSSSNLSCFGACDGVATANASGGANPYQFLWSTNPIQVTGTATGLCAGTYTVTATDANGCFNTATVTFNNPPLLTATLSGTNTSCNAACDGTVTATPAGGTGAYSYLWSPGGQTTQTATGLCAGTYTVSVSDANNCQYSDTISITQSPSIAANETVTDANCNLSDGSITLAPSGGVAPYTFLWSPGGQTTQNLSNVAAGIYVVAITDVAGCSSSFTITVSNLNGPTLATISTDISCFGGCDGTASVNVTGGTGPFTYLWSPGGQTVTAVTNLCSGIHNVQVTDAMGCITIASVNINEPTELSSNAVISNASCGGVCDGSITLNVTGGAGPYSYAWSPGGQTTSSVSGLCAGSYSVIVTDFNGCDSVMTFTITEPLILTVTMNSSNVTCFNACNGTATATPVGGTGPYSYSWSPNVGVLPNVVNLCPNTYTVTVTDANGCTAMGTVTITEPPQLTSSIVSTNVTCNASCDGTATITGTGGTTPYTYLWSPINGTTQTASNLCAGTYNVSLSDANNCVSSQTVVITQPNPLVPGATATNASCNAACNGSATANPTGGTGPYSFAWAPGGQTSQTITALCAGIYTVTITDANGCSAFQAVTINEPAVLLANTTSTSPLCVGNCNGTATSSPIGGTAPFIYTWSPGAQTTQTASGLCAGSYTVMVTDVNGCSTNQSIVVNSPAGIDIVASVAPANCGTNNGTITVTPVTGVAPYTYVWANAPSTTNQAINLGAGIYTVTVTDANSCDSTFAITLSNSGGPTGATFATVDISCPGSCDGSSSFVPAGGTGPYTFVWYDAAGNPIGVTNDTALALCAGIYNVGITDANGCIFFASDTIGQPVPVAANATITQTTCSGICNGSISLAPTGGTGPYTFLWMPGGATTSSITNLCGGTYTVTITDNTGCSRVDSFQVTPSIVLSASVVTSSISCSNACTGTASVTVSTGAAPYTYLWNDPFGQASPNATNLCSGTYSVIITDAVGCNITLPVAINSTNPISANPSVTDATCNMCDGTAALAPTGGTAPFTYIWNTGSTSSSVNGLCAGLYFVSITDSNGCSSSFQVPVSNVGAPSVTATVTNESCANACDGSATLTITGGTGPYSILWMPGGQTTATVNNLCGGIYYVQVQDANGCSAVDTVVIGGGTSIADNRTVINATCGSSNGSITLNPTGGTAPYTYVWTPAVSAGNSAVNLAAGIYNVTITDANGCSKTVSIAISNPGGPGITLSSTDVTCNGSANGIAIADTTGGSTGPFSYSWSNGQSNDTITGLAPGTYVVQVADSAGCVSSAQIMINEPLPISFSLPVITNESCANSCNGTAAVIASGGTMPYTFAWTGTTSSTSSASGLCAGSYTATVTDANGCSASNTLSITGPAPLSVTNAVTDASCNMVNDGVIDVTVTGGTAPYTYSWSPGGATTEDLTSILMGSYTFTVTDANNCTSTSSITVNAVLTVVANAGNDSTFCEGGGFTLDASGSTNAVSYQWFQLPGNTPVGNTVSVTVNPTFGSTSYVVIATNGACTDADTITITSNPLPIADAGTDATILIFNSANLGGNPTGPAGSTYSWNPVAGLNDSIAANPIASPTVTTTYTVTVTSSTGCVSVDSVTITVFPQIIFPNGISPNGDGANDEWIIDNIEQFPNCVVEVYNRWGEMLFRSVGYKDRWDGTYKGQPLPVGTYYYIINLNDPLYPDAFTGPITILR